MTIESIWVPVWDQVKYEGQKELIFDSNRLKTVRHRYIKCVGGTITTTNEVFKRLLDHAVWSVYLNNKIIWCYPIFKKDMNTEHGIVKWERKIPIPFTITDEDIIRIEITDIADMGELVGHGISVNLNCYVRNCGCDYCSGVL